MDSKTHKAREAFVFVGHKEQEKQEIDKVELFRDSGEPSENLLHLLFFVDKISLGLDIEGFPHTAGRLE